MEKEIRTGVITVKGWEEEEQKIYLLTHNGKRYRYVGKYDISQIKEMFPVDKALIIKPVFTGNNEILFDCSISSC